MKIAWGVAKLDGHNFKFIEPTSLVNESHGLLKWSLWEWMMFVYYISIFFWTQYVYHTPSAVAFTSAIWMRRRTDVHNQHSCFRNCTVPKGVGVAEDQTNKILLQVAQIGHYKFRHLCQINSIQWLTMKCIFCSEDLWVSFSMWRLKNVLKFLFSYHNSNLV